MVPTAAMLFLGHHQYWKANPSSLQYPVSNTSITFHVKFTDRMASNPPPSPPQAVGEAAGEKLEREDGKEVKTSSMEDKFEESLRLSCWS
ncbi:hypothetical protein COCNU_05G001030 [Cocos nucifera]|uniref:Uncharacterized protein n=1 Tax=Cocos nucifera TaxID=13894 RepID=A0A8K0I8C4_COCNU|nr:hypothetical protein COCNU_05G001030 [Cocos nucifera]